MQPFNDLRSRSINSFEKLAYSLAKTEEEQKTLRGITDIQKSKERAEKLIFFVKEKLRGYPNWLLIYDNVEKFSDIQDYYPYDANIWGPGEVVITTRNANIKHNIHIPNTILIEELEACEKLELFMKISKHNDKGVITPLQQENIKKFLVNIPSFPLDVSIAAYYLKATNLSYEKYLTRLSEHGKEFESLQENILKEGNSYVKTRYGIITMSLREVLKTNKEFANLILFIALLDSQNIPKDLLAAYKSEEIVDNLIYHLNKYSLIINSRVPSDNENSTISLHRSTQKICLDYLVKELKLENNFSLQQSIFHTLDNYIESAIDQEDFKKMKLLVEHCKTFLGHIGIINNNIINEIKVKIGSMYYYLGDYELGKKWIESNIKVSNFSSFILAENLETLGNIYRESGNYEKGRELLEKSLLIYRKTPNVTRLQIASALSSLGHTYSRMENYEKAQTILEESLNNHTEYYHGHSTKIACTLYYLSIVYNNKGYFKQAKELIEQSIEAYSEGPNKNILGIARSKVQLAFIYSNLGNLGKAAILLESSLKIFNQYYSEDHLLVGWISSRLGSVYRLLGQYVKAKNLIEKSLEIYKEKSSSHKNIAGDISLLGCINNDLGEYQTAKILLEESLKIYQQHYKRGHPYIVRTSTYLGGIYALLKHFEQSRNLINENIAGYKVDYSLNPQFIGIKFYLGNAYKELGEYKKATILIKESLEIFKNKFGINNVLTASALMSLGEVYLRDNNTKMAEPLLNQALSIFKQNKHPSSYKCLEILSQLNSKQSSEYLKAGNKLQAQKYKQAAINNLQEAIKIVIEHFPQNSPPLKRLESQLKQL